MLLRRIPSAAWHVSRHAVATAHAAHASAAHVMGSTTHAWSKETLWTSTDSAIRSRLRRRRNPSHALLRWIRRIGDVGHLPEACWEESHREAAVAPHAPRAQLGNCRPAATGCSCRPAIECVAGSKVANTRDARQHAQGTAPPRVRRSGEYQARTCGGGGALQVLGEL